MILWVRGSSMHPSCLVACAYVPRIPDSLGPGHPSPRDGTREVSVPLSPAPLCPRLPPGSLPSLSPFFHSGPGKWLRCLVGFPWRQRRVQNRREAALLGGGRELSPPVSPLVSSGQTSDPRDATARWELPWAPSALPHLPPSRIIPEVGFLSSPADSLSRWTRRLWVASL